MHDYEILKTIMISTTKNIWFSICIFLCPVAAISDQLTFTTGDWPPYIFESNGTVDANMPGFSIEIVNAVFAKLGHSITFKTAPFLRQISETGQGKYLALAGTYREEAPKLLFPQEPIGMTQNCFYTSVNNPWYFKDLKQLSSIKIAVVSGYTYGKIDSYIATRKENFVKISGSEQHMMSRLVKLLEYGRVTAFIQDAAVAEYFFRQEGIEDQYKSAGCLEPIPSMIGFAPNDPRSQGFANAFDREITKLRESGELERILVKYGVSDWK